MKPISVEIVRRWSQPQTSQVLCRGMNFVETFSTFAVAFPAALPPNRSRRFLVCGRRLCSTARRMCATNTCTVSPPPVHCLDKRIRNQKERGTCRPLRSSSTSRTSFLCASSWLSLSVRSCSTTLPMASNRFSHLQDRYVVHCLISADLVSMVDVLLISSC